MSTRWVAFSGGKESVLALSRSLSVGRHVDGLLSTIDANSQRARWQGASREVLRAQARMLGLPIHFVELVEAPTNDQYLSAIRERLEAEEVDQLVFGDVHLEDIRSFREQGLGDLVTLEFPLWNEPSRPLVREGLSLGLSIRIISIDPEKMPREALGTMLDVDALMSLPEGVDPAGEGGEFHTLVTAIAGCGSLDVDACGVFEDPPYLVEDLVLSHADDLHQS